MHYSSDIFQSFIVTMLASKDDVKYHLLNKSDLHLSHLMTILIVGLNWFKIIAYWRKNIKVKIVNHIEYNFYCYYTRHFNP